MEKSALTFYKLKTNPKKEKETPISLPMANKP